MRVQLGEADTRGQWARDHAGFQLRLDPGGRQDGPGVKGMEVNP